MPDKNGLPRSWREITWNPPIYRAASGAYIADRNGDGKLDEVYRDPDNPNALNPRELSAGVDSYAMRRARKGVIFQHTQFPAADWSYPAGDGYEAGSALGDKRYGFRFHYNPSTIEYGIGVNNTNVNPVLYMMRQDGAVPITPPGGDVNGAGVRFQIYLNRIEDMQFLSQRRNGLTQFQMPSADRVREFYGTNEPLTKDDCRQIFERGTGYDMEFLFRTLMGAPQRTLLRGETADLGYAFNVPLILDFSASAAPMSVTHSQRYLGRVSSISYNHLSFTPNMVPMWTQVAIDFARYPDMLPSTTSAGRRSWREAQATYDRNREWSEFYSQGGLPQVGVNAANAPSSSSNYVPWVGPATPGDNPWGVNPADVPWLNP